MTQIAVEIPTGDGLSDGTLHTPDGNGPWPGVVIFPDAGGTRQTFRDMADRLASTGYAVLVPNVYYREGEIEPFDMATVFADQEQFNRLMGLMRTLTTDRIVTDTGAYLEFLLARDEVTGDGAGTTGYCMGGRISLLAAGAHPDKVAAAASFHGGFLARPEDPDSPHHAASRMRAKVYVAGAENDEYYTPEQAKLLESALTDAGVDNTCEFYPAAHGFAVPDNPTHDAEAEARHWRALEGLYGSTLAS